MKIIKFTLMAFLAMTFTFISCNEDDGPCTESMWFEDADGDGFGNFDVTLSACDQPDGFVESSNDIDDTNATLNPNSVWQGESITFTKANNADWNLEENQDRITDNVWLTRQDNRSLFNIFTELEQIGGYGSTLSPANTEWARGEIIDGIGNLQFNRFTGTLDNNIGDNILNGPLVLHLLTDDIYIDVTFTSWTSGGMGGGFTYVRSTRM